MRPAFGALPLEPFRYYHYGTRTVHLDGCVEVEAAYYSAPPGWIGRQLQVQWTDVVVRLLDPKTGQLLREHIAARAGGIASRTRIGRRERRPPRSRSSPRRTAPAPRLARSAITFTATRAPSPSAASSACSRSRRSAGRRSSTTRRGVNFQGYGDLMVTSTYDGAGRKTYEASGTSKSDTYAYDPAGNVIQHVSGNGTVSTTYDAANRPIRRVVPEVDYSSTPCSSFITGASCAYSFPTFGGSSVCISADTAFFAYDAAGRVLQADNMYARVHRTYKPNGLVATEAQSLRSYNSNGTSACEVGPAGGSASLFSNHNYNLTYTYDLDGRRTALAHPAGTQHYTYDPASPSTGWLTSVTDIANLSYSLAYDAAGRLRQLAIPEVSTR